MGFLLPARPFRLEAALPPEALRAAVFRVLRRPPTPKSPTEPARWLLGDVADDGAVRLQPAPRVEDPSSQVSWWYRSVGELAGRVEPAPAGAALAGTFRVRGAAGATLLPLLAVVAVAALVVLLAGASSVAAAPDLGRGLKAAAKLLLVPAALFLLPRALLDLQLERDHRVVERLLREEVAVAEAERGRGGASR